MSRVELKIEKSRFAALKIENDDDFKVVGGGGGRGKPNVGVGQKKSTSNGPNSNNQQQATKKKIKKNKSESESSSSGSNLGSANKEPDWESWKERDEEVKNKSLNP